MQQQGGSLPLWLAYALRGKFLDGTTDGAIIRVQSASCVEIAEEGSGVRVAYMGQQPRLGPRRTTQWHGIDLSVRQYEFRSPSLVIERLRFYPPGLGGPVERVRMIYCSRDRYLMSQVCDKHEVPRTLVPPPRIYTVRPLLLQLPNY